MLIEETAGFLLGAVRRAGQLIDFRTGCAEQPRDVDERHAQIVEVALGPIRVRIRHREKRVEPRQLRPVPSEPAFGDPPPPRGNELRRHSILLVGKLPIVGAVDADRRRLRERPHARERHAQVSAAGDRDIGFTDHVVLVAKPVADAVDGRHT